uniref:Large ribosomal subunit protein mL43 n=1 Tax=Hirondellea gigas TaxID=1518452 RepID=A0A2P2I3U7_9CRUS
MTSHVWNLFFGATFAKTPHHNGIGRFVQQLQRITIKFCKSNGSSMGTRDYLEQDLVHFANANPGVVVYVKSRRHRTPVIKAEYLNGETEFLSLHNKPRDEIQRWMEHYRTRSGQPTARLLKTNYTDLLSIQGTWTPWTNVHPETFLDTFPCEKASAAEKIEKTGTDQLREIAERASRAS